MTDQTDHSSLRSPAPGGSGLSQSGLWLLVGFSLAFLVVLLAIGLIARAKGPPEQAVNLALGLLLANLVLVIGLGLFLGRALRAMFRSDEAGARLRVRFAALFSLAAVVPALIIALFFGLLVTRGIDGWFNQRIRSVVENSASVARSYVDQQTGDIRDHLVAMAGDVEDAAPALATSPVAFGHFLGDQSRFHAFASVSLLTSGGTVLASAGSADSPFVEMLPPGATFGAASAGDVIMRPFEDTDTIRALYRIRAIPDAFLYVARPIDAGILDHLRYAEASLIDYRSTDSVRSRLQGLFALSYLEAALLVLFGAIWLGVGAANRIAGPVARLVNAAGRVASGDLTVRLEARDEPEEIAVLSRAFNRMTGDLREQQDELRRAGIDADSRRQFIETVLSGVSAGVMSRDAAGAISAINRQGEWLLGLTGSQTQGRMMGDLAPDLEPLALQALRQGGTVDQEIDIEREGENLHLQVRASALRDGTVILTFDDITRLITAQRNAAWRDVARRIAHEIKNPLTPIQLSAERLKRRFRKFIDSDLETFDRCTDTIVRQVTDIGRMVDEFSDFARMPAPRFEVFDLAELVREAVFVQKVASPDISVTVHELPPVDGFGDPRLLAQALANILKNAGEAVSARPRDDAGLADSGSIEVELESQGAQAFIRVSDNGPGLPARERDRLTEPYVTTRKKGTGLGLAIVKRVLEDHNGSLVLGDRADGRRGALVTLILPISGRSDPSPSSSEAQVPWQ